MNNTGNNNIAENVGMGGENIQTLEPSHNPEFSSEQKFQLLWAVKQFQPYIFGKEILVQTDHNPLRWLQQMKNTNPRLTRWSLALQTQAMEIVHRAGIKHGNADGLSRA